MKKSDVVIGKVYVMKVSGSLHPVRLEVACSYGGWSGTNLDTGRTVRIKTAAKLRREWPTNPTKMEIARTVLCFQGEEVPLVCQDTH